jgi:uncharacterized protein (DUF849 family)
MRKKVPLVVPAGAVILFRPDTVSEAHPMGWRDFTVGVEGASLIAYLHQLRTRTPNEYNARQDNERFKAQKAEERERQVTCTHAALELGVPMRSKPKKITVARVSSRKIRDDDNLVGALKWIRDGIADALKIDDSEFSIFAAEGKIPLVYEQRLSGKLGVYGVRIEIEWRTA